MSYSCILCDPPWPQKMVGKFKQTRNSRPTDLPYTTMSVEEIKSLPLGDLAVDGCHLWLWTTNQYLETGFQLLKAWGFKYLAPITWVKPSGCGAYFISRTQTLLFGYKGRCVFPAARYKPTVLYSKRGNHPHSTKPEESYELIESISPSPRLEVFARRERPGWTTVGNAIDGRDVFEALKNPSRS